MENRYKNIIYLKINLKNEFSNLLILDFIEANKHSNFTMDFFDNFYESISEIVKTNTSEKLISFIYSYKNGILKPYKWNDAEPINKLVDDDTPNKTARILSNPGGSICFKRKETNLKYQSDFENDQFAIIFEGRGKKAIYQRPTASMRKYLMVLRFWFNKRDVIKNGYDIEFFKQLIYDLGCIFDLGTYYIHDEDEHNPIFEGDGKDSIFSR